MICPICGHLLKGTKDDDRLYCPNEDTYFKNPPSEKWEIPGEMKD